MSSEDTERLRDRALPRLLWLSVDELDPLRIFLWAAGEAVPRTGELAREISDRVRHRPADRIFPLRWASSHDLRGPRLPPSLHTGRESR